jgi:hypothetical protein
MSIETAPGERPSARTDLAWSALWTLLGGAIVAESVRMDRLEHLNVNPYTVPGLVPGLLGAVIALLGAALALRSLLRRDAPAARGAPALRRLALGTALFLAYALGLVSRVPFWLATLVFVSGFIFVFERPERRTRSALARGFVLALAIGAGTAAAVTYLFQGVFLVQLP